MRRHESKSVRSREESKRFSQTTKRWSSNRLEFSFFSSRFLRNTSSFVTLSMSKMRAIMKSLFRSYRRRRQRSIVRPARRRRRSKRRKKRLCTPSPGTTIATTPQAPMPACPMPLAIETNGARLHDQQSVPAHATYASPQSTPLEPALYARNSRPLSRNIWSRKRRNVARRTASRRARIMHSQLKTTAPTTGLRAPSLIILTKKSSSSCQRRWSVTSRKTSKLPILALRLQ